MNWKENRKPVGDFIDNSQQWFYDRGIINVGGAMQGQQGIAARLNPKSFPGFLPYRQFYVLPKGVYHAVTHEMNVLFRNSFSLQVFVRRFFGSKEQGGQMVSHYPVDLFRHGSVKRPKPGFHMGQGNLLFGGYRATAKCNLHPLPQ